METNKTTSSASVCNYVAVEPFDWNTYEQTEQSKQAKEQNKLDNLKDEITYYKNLIQKKQRDIRRAERSIARAERELKEAQEAERARKIKELLEANAEQPILFYCVFDDYLASIAKDVVIYQNANNCWCVKRVGEGNKWEVAIEAVEAIFVKAKI